ncbi:putative T6SS immunity periplasmic lipoprotein [Enterobacter mori]|uniref:putative T6SS immunity periplasmic lipoprotein n=1 Tax=Enterobacter mori TaxID=539813 RepID=UPI003B843B9D
MKLKILFIPIISMLTGCPGENLNIPEQRTVMINGNHICFSVDEKEILNGYSVSSVQHGEYKELATAEFQNRSYPDSCIDIALPAGYAYEISYTLNERNYYYPFFKDNDGRVINYH